MSTIQTQFTQFIKERKFSNRLRPATIVGYEHAFRLFSKIMPEIDEPHLFTTSVITTFFDRLQNRSRLVGREMKVTGIKNSTALGYCNRLNAFCKWLYVNKQIDTNPFENLSFPKVKYEDKRNLEKLDIQKIIASILINSAYSLLMKRDLMMVHILLLCGVRRSELISIKIPHIDLEKRMLEIKGETSKSKFTRFIPLNPTVLMYIKEYLKARKEKNYKTPFLIVSSKSDDGMTIYGLKHWVKKIIKNSGVRFHLHMFRHTFACNLANMNVNAVKIQKLLGHTDIRMTMSYLRSISAEDIRGDMERLDIENFI